MNTRMNLVLMRSIISLVIGVLLVIYPGDFSIYLVMSIGALFMIPGIIAVIAYMLHRNELRSFPVIGLGSTLFGLWLLIMPGFFVTILMYALGTALILAGINMTVGLVNARRFAVVPLGFYTVPVLIIIAGVVVLVNPFATAEIPFIMLGVSGIVYALSDIFNALKFRDRTVGVVEVTESEDTALLEAQDTDDEPESVAEEVKE